MKIEQIYTGCLAQGAYYITSKGEAAIIDPLREIQPYLDRAQKDGVKIKYIFETHFHADFVSGHIDLSKATAAPIVYGPTAQPEFDAIIASDGQEFRIGNITLKALHTPGHTMESSCFLLKDEQGKNHAVFTGDTLFVGDVGRPDLAQKENVITMEDLAGMMYDSLQTKIIPLADDVIVYPAHGAGSSCGKNLGPETFSTIGDQKKTNYALQAKTKEEFIRAVTEGLAEPPQYYPINAQINKQGYSSLDAVLTAGLQPLSVSAFKEAAAKDDVIVLDTRPSAEFPEGFVPGSISIGLDGRCAEWAGSLLSFNHSILLVTTPGKEKETIVRLARVGFDKMIGYLNGGIEAWQQAGESIDMIINVDADELAMDIPFDDHLVIVDVRKETEFANGHLKDAVNLPLDSLKDPGSMSDLDDAQNMYVHCLGGYRSVIAASLIKKEGFHNIRNVVGGWNAISQLGNKVTIVKEAAVVN
jgi:glyoxylase-like metal-dependent hydrolase (beta-lactamase superfamily II)/rhodanese-related sulfurtransferase